MKINIGKVKNLTESITSLHTKMVAYGIPQEDDAIALLDIHIPQASINTCVAAILAIPKYQDVRKVDKATGGITSDPVRKYITTPFHIYEPNSNGDAIIETFDGNPKGFEAIEDFLKIDLAINSVEISPIEVDLNNVLSDVRALYNDDLVTLKRASIKNYQPDTSTIGSFGPKFTDEIVATQIIQSNIDNVKSIVIEIKDKNAKATLRCTPDGSFSIKAKSDDMIEFANVARTIGGTPYRGYVPAFTTIKDD